MHPVTKGVPLKQEQEHETPFIHIVSSIGNLLTPLDAFIRYVPTREGGR